MKTHYNQKPFELQRENSRDVVAHFNGDNISSDSSGLLLQHIGQVTGIIAQFTNCFKPSSAL